MNSQELLALKKAYNQVYQVDEQVDDMGLSDAQRSVNRATNPRNLDVTRASASIAAKKAERIARSMHPTPGTIGVRLADEYDLYDIILSHLLDEGYADTEKAAEAIMVNMSEDWRESIMEGVRPGNVESPLDKAAFKKRRRSLAGREKSADAKSRGHVSKNIITHGRTYSPDEAKSNRAKLSDYEREQRKSFNINPDQVGDTRETADKTKNPKKLRKQTAMDEH